MSLNDRFIATTVSWFRDRPEEVTRVVEQSFTDPNQGAHVEWRNSPIEDYRRRIVPAGAERLIRWDQRSPNEIFRDGFSPRVIPREGQIPRDAANLSPYVRDYARHPNSIFVSAARYYRNRRGNVARWAPRNRTGIYEDEVFAHGGIDVNLSIGDHRDFSQHEIAFSGGIRGEFIRSARHYNSSGSPRDLVLNSLFTPSANPNSQTNPQVTDGDLPPTVTPQRGQIVTWTPCRPYYPTSQREMAETEMPLESPIGSADLVASGDNWTEIMREPGYEEEVSEGETNWPSRASMLVPGKKNRAYFFSGTRYVEIHFEPHNTNDYIVPGGGPHTIVSKWPALDQAGFGVVDAALPRTDYNGQVYFFRQTNYVLVDLSRGPEGSKILEGPKAITDGWSPLRKAGFTTVDAVLASSRKGEAYLFRGSQYVLIDVGGGTTNGALIGGPKDTSSNWPSLSQAKFQTIDSILPIEERSQEVYFFSGWKYARIWYKPGTKDDKITNGPKYVNSEWPSLSRDGAGFY